MTSLSAVDIPRDIYLTINQLLSYSQQTVHIFLSFGMSSSVYRNLIQNKSETTNSNTIDYCLKYHALVDDSCYVCDTKVQKLTYSFTKLTTKSQDIEVKF